MKKTIKNYRLEGRKAIIRCDFNVPLNSKNKITDYTRIKANLKTIRYAVMKGAKVIFQDTHVSGHACQEEIKLIYSLVKPKYAIPVHGEYRHLCAQRDVVMALGYDKDHVFIAKSGDIIELSDDHGEIVGQVPTGAILVDGLGEAKAVVEDSVQGCLDKHISDWSKIKNIIKDDLSEYLWKKMKRNPVILPIIMEAQM